MQPAALQLPAASPTPAPTADPAPGAALAPAAAPVSAEFRVNTTIAGRQENSSITRLKGGGHVIAWISSSEFYDGTSIPADTQGVCTQRYGVDGAALGQETCRAPEAVFLSKPALAALEDGGYLLVWPVRQTDGAGFDHNLFAQRFDASGAPVRAVQQINSTTLSSYLYPTIAAAGLADGGYVVTWGAAAPLQTNRDIYARRFDADGAPCPCGAEKRVNTLVSSSNLITRSDPAVAALADGGYVVTWAGTGQRAFTGTAIYAQRYGAQNSPIGPEAILTPDTSGDLLGASSPAVSGLAGGGYAVAYFLARGQTVPVIAVQSFRSDGTVLAAQSAVNPLLAPLPTCTRLGAVGPCPRPVASPAVAALDDGGFVVVFNEGIGPAATESYARRYGANGAPTGDPTQLASGFQPAVSGTSQGGFMLSLQHFDGNGDGIFARYFGALPIDRNTAP
ncbi:hypothetical protein [Polaromonas glacialis]|uniref:hypothetical protein n=1 Tax=Polaromonas glacialis TaxID=866564 RepID=UPI0004971887|nr:hypothetical protein [Polaromonas glacialis]